MFLIIGCSLNGEPVESTVLQWSKHVVGGLISDRMILTYHLQKGLLEIAPQH